MTHSPSDPRHAWVDESLDRWFEISPVDATFVGQHAHDSSLPNLTPEGVDGGYRALQAQLELRPGSDPGAVAGDARLAALDEALMADALEVRLWEYESRWMLDNPSIHAGEAVFSLMSLLLPQHSGPEDARMRALGDRLRGLPAFLDAARGQLRDAPVAWTERALRECRGGEALLSEGFRHVPFGDEAASQAALSAIREYASFLETDLSTRPREQVGCGADGLELYMKRGHRLRRSAEEVAERAREELALTREWVAGHAADAGVADAREVPGRLAALHPTADGYYDAYTQVWEEMRAVAGDRSLLTWPDAPIRYGPRPEWSRAAAPDLYFLFYRSPAAYARPDVHDYMVSPLPSDPTAHDAFLTAHNDSVIKLNHVVHHGGIGHHVQNWHAFRSPLRMGRVAAVDCASRIAFFSGGTMAEGWACYATDLMAEAGGLTDLEVFAEHMGRIRMCARAIADVEIHLGRMDLEQAAAFYVSEAGMPAASAHAEAVKNSMFPGAAVIYLEGTDLIHELRADLMKIQGDDFDLASFHDAFLSWGSIPVRVIADEMTRRAQNRVPLGAHDSIPTAPETP